MEALWIILVGSVIAISCGLLGSFLVLRKMAMVGDAISHAVLPGIVLADLFSGSRGTIPMLIGAAALGVLTTLLIELFYKKAKLQIDASIGITFTWLFAIGIIMISLFAGQVDLDQDCVLYGEIAYVPLDLWFIGDFNIGPRTLWISAAMLIVVLLIIIRGYKGLFLTTFNEEYASALGINVAFWHYLLMSSVSLTTVISFESVGAILVVAFLIVPPATAYLLTTKLKQMLWLTALFAVLSSIFGYYLAVLINGSIAGAMATVAGVLFVIVWGITAVRKRRERKVVVENLDMRI